jgi:BolA protein
MGREIEGGTVKIMTLSDEIASRLRETFAPSRLQVIDESEGHRGHAGYRDGGESHWRVVISAPALASMSRLARHRAIHAAFGPEIIGRIHALAIEAD